MKKNIKGVIYDTDKAKLIHSYRYEDWFTDDVTDIYITENHKLFVHRYLEARGTKYQESINLLRIVDETELVQDYHEYWEED